MKQLSSNLVVDKQRSLVPNADRKTAEDPFVLKTSDEGFEYDTNENDSIYPIGNPYQAENTMPTYEFGKVFR